MTVSVLFVALEDGRRGPARLVQEFARTGATVAAMAPAGNAILASSHLDATTVIKNPKSSRSFAQALGFAMRHSNPEVVIPCDEQTVVALRYQLRLRRLPFYLRQVLQDSLGQSLYRDTLLMKDKCLALAATLGVPVPEAITVSSVEDVRVAGAALGFPLFMKSSFSWAGLGTIACETTAEACQAFDALSPPKTLRPLKAMAKKWLARDWYPSSSAIQMQRAVSGVPAMFCAVAWKGRYLGGFAGIASKRSGATGPSTEVELGANAIFEQHVSTLIEATGASGFLGFDFMWDEATEAAVLLECNPRPIQVCHLGRSIGVDLCRLLAGAVQGRAARHGLHPRSRKVALFPQAWFAGHLGERDPDAELDLPQHDNGLMEHILAQGRRHGLSSMNGWK